MASAVEPAVIAAAASLTVGFIAAYAGKKQGDETRNMQETLAGQQQELQRELAGKQQEFAERLTELSNRLERQAREEERRLNASEALERFRLSIREAADDLGHRIHNVRCKGFLLYVQTPNPRQETAVLGTLYRFARYFATLEILYDQIDFLKLERADATSHVAKILKEIGRTFASDDYDKQDGPTTSRFMIWREEQRAMAEIARDLDRTTVVGFATFVAKARTEFAPWLSNLQSDFTSGDAGSSQRLELLQSWLARLVRSLDSQLPDRQAAGPEPPWMQKAAPDPRAIQAPRASPI